MPDAIDLQRQFEATEKKEVLIFNPLSYDVEWKYDGVDQTPIVSQENISLPPSKAKVLGNKLVDLYLATKEKNYQREKAERLVFSD